jgi:hypothetical protein
MPPPENVWFPEADHDFEGIVLIFGIYFWRVKV